MIPQHPGLARRRQEVQGSLDALEAEATRLHTVAKGMARDHDFHGANYLAKLRRQVQQVADEIARDARVKGLL